VSSAGSRSSRPPSGEARAEADALEAQPPHASRPEEEEEANPLTTPTTVKAIRSSGRDQPCRTAPLPTESDGEEEDILSAIASTPSRSTVSQVSVSWNPHASRPEEEEEANPLTTPTTVKAIRSSGRDQPLPTESDGEEEDILSAIASTPSRSTVSQVSVSSGIGSAGWLCTRVNMGGRSSENGCASRASASARALVSFDGMLGQVARRRPSIFAATE
jgi:hypothetical protein